MSSEIERKFLVKNDHWRFDENGNPIKGVVFRQGYLPVEEGITVRVRLEGEDAKLTIKSKTIGITRQEYEYAIPKQDAEEMLNGLCQKPMVEKVRYCREENGVTWEIDEFSGENDGLIVAEVELSQEDQLLELPDWVDREVSGDARYFNVNLVANPFKCWIQ